jgi:hypothetical protein
MGDKMTDEEELEAWRAKGYTYLDKDGLAEFRGHRVNLHDDHEGVRLALEYYSMPHPRVKTLARVLAWANEHLPRDYRYGKFGTTSAKALEKDIGRSLRETRHLCIEKMTPEERGRALLFQAKSCEIDKSFRRRQDPYARAVRRRDSAQRAMERLRRR